jgi:hypothetical protein
MKHAKIEKKKRALNTLDGFFLSYRPISETLVQISLISFPRKVNSQFTNFCATDTIFKYTSARL